MNTKTLQDCTDSHFGFRVSSKVARFGGVGWFAIGKTACDCPKCVNPLWGFRKPYFGGKLLYWALICINCRIAYERSELSTQQKKLLNKSMKINVESSEENIETNPTHSLTHQKNSVQNPSKSEKNITNLCQTCKHVKILNETQTCKALQKKLGEIGPMLDCVHYNFHIETNSVAAESMEKRLKDRSNQEQAPDKYATDNFKFFNKIKRK